MAQGPADSFGFIEIIFTGVVALGLGFWQLRSINREIAKDKAKAAEKAALDSAPGEP